MSNEPTSNASMGHGGTSSDWYKDAVIYQLHVRSFQDGNGDGIGDFDGLTSRLDYLRNLGVTALWLLPFYPSPLRDDGYDIADYRTVNPIYGDLRSFTRFLAEAHRRDLRVITELVMNHTSDQHPWFQRARRAPAGSVERDVYVWSDDPTRYPEVRIIFQDFETSNWTWDPVAQAYYWHRFYHHQPDLNFENPWVRQAMFDALDHWFDLGVDGLRLDAIPYLYEADGSNGENLPETHQFLKDLRTHIDDRYGDRVLLAEANQWPEDAVEYFGDPPGDECHMAFHFPLMPRLYMALQREDRFPIVDILEQTPSLPEHAQWAIFLRNHDELTLEMVTDEERDSMYRAYASDPRMRVNLGIRRRLTTLLGGDRRRNELLNVLLFSMPGTPIVYYGDEIGMGDNIYLGDRDGVRTPMQWTADRNAGFSSASPQQLFLPLITEPGYHYTTVNVEAQEQSDSSLLWWIRRLIALRRRHPQFARGDLVILEPENPHVLAFLRTLPGHDPILVIANLSRHAQPVELNLLEEAGTTPVELFGQARFAPIGVLPYYLTIAPHGTYWLRLERQTDRAEVIAEPPSLDLSPQWSGAAPSSREARTLAEAVERFLPRQRWYGGKDRPIAGVRLTRIVQVSKRPAQALVVASVSYAGGDADDYLLALAEVDGRQASDVAAIAGHQIVCRIDDRESLIVDAAAHNDVLADYLGRVGAARAALTNQGVTVDLPAAVRRRLRSDESTVRVLRADQSNTGAFVDDQLFCKLLRRFGDGPNPDIEVTAKLTEAGFDHIAPLLGHVDLATGRNRSAPLLVVTRQVNDEGDGFGRAVDQASRMLERALVEDVPVPNSASGDALAAARRNPPEAIAALAGESLDDAARLGRVVGRLHVAMAGIDDPAFGRESLTKMTRRSLYQSFRNDFRSVVLRLRRNRAAVPEWLRPAVERLLESERALLDRADLLRSQPIGGARIRIHGDLHLGQTIWTGRDYVLLDFEGEPDRPASERRLRYSPLRDVAGVVRSYHYVAAQSLRLLRERGFGHEATTALDRWAEQWEHWCTASLLGGYLDTVAGHDLLPQDQDLAAVLDVYVLQKLAYEVGYELGSRPQMVHIPLLRLAAVLEPAEASTSTTTSFPVQTESARPSERHM